MTDDTLAPTDAASSCLSSLVGEIDGETLQRFASFAKASQFKSVFGRNLHLANWFEALGDIVRDELRRRDGKNDQVKVAAPDAHLRERTEVMTDRELEALGMGFASLMAAASRQQDTALLRLIEAVYEPVREEYVRRHGVSRQDIVPSPE